MEDQINESILFNNSINEYKYKQNLLLYLWLMGENKSMKPFEYFKIIPYELIREISEFLILGKKRMYYQVIDNYTFYEKVKLYRLTHPSLLKCSWWQKRLRTPFVGKCIKDKSINNKLSEILISNITTYLENKNHKILTIFSLNKLVKKLYYISYIGWTDNHNEYVSRKQISLIDNTKNKWSNINIGYFMDCQHPIDKKYYRGMITKIHYSNGSIIGVDVIIICPLVALRGRYNYVWIPNIPLYSNRIIDANIHNRGEYTSFLRYQLSWIYVTYKNNYDLYYSGKSNKIEYIQVLRYVNTEFKIKNSMTPKWKCLYTSKLESSLTAYYKERCNSDPNPLIRMFNFMEQYKY